MTGERGDQSQEPSPIIMSRQTSMTNLGETKFAVVVLAAGGSRRLSGRPKQWLRYRGETLLRRAANAALALRASSTVVVLGARSDEMQAALEDLPLSIVINSDWESGISSSIRAALDSVSKQDVAAVIFMLCDQPLVSASVLERLRDTFLETKMPIIASRYGESLGVPALFSRETFHDFEGLRGDEGAKKIITKDIRRTVAVDVPEAALDIDTAEDFERVSAGWLLCSPIIT